MKKNLIIILLSGLLFSMATFAATTYYYTSNEVSYTLFDISCKIIIFV